MYLGCMWLRIIDVGMANVKCVNPKVSDDYSKRPRTAGETAGVLASTALQKTRRRTCGL